MQYVFDIEDIWSSMNSKLNGFISKYVKNNDDVRDIIQDTFIKVKLNINSLSNPAKVENWIFQIARNTMNDHFRNKKKLIEKQDESIKDTDSEDSEEEAMIKNQTLNFSDYTGFVVSQLPDKYRKAVIMADIEGRKMSDIAKEFNISISGAKSRVQRGRKMIKEIILQCCEVTSDNYGNIVEYKPRSCKKSDPC
jgi:RNA polymerase sigma-70 factor, ECF subfamily